jgi:aryl-alcohol dehydrogenase-like predicted oxidoreductase
MDRREFLRTSAAAGLGLGLLPLAAQTGQGLSDEGPPRVRRTVTLGRTGLEVSDIGFGGSRLRGDEKVVRRALERGVRYFDTAESYTDGASEETLGRVLPAQRDRVVIASKVGTSEDDDRKTMMRALEGSLRRLRTDRVDVYFNHAVNEVAVVRNPEWLEFASRARQQGKIRFTGISGHGPRLVPCIDAALDDDLVDVLLVGFNFGQDPAFYQRFVQGLDFVARQPDLPRVLQRARKKGVGTIAMKTQMGAKLNDMRPFEKNGASFSQAALRWTLGTGLVDALIISMKSPEQVDEYLGASGYTGLVEGDAALLKHYLAANGALQCRYGCDTCADACPGGVPIAGVLRSQMYARDYEEPELARREYGRLGAAASACASCTGEPCATACPYGLPIGALTRSAHATLS